MKSSVVLRFLFTALLVIESIGTSKGDELFAVGPFGTVFVNPTTGKGVSNTNVVWDGVNSLAQDNQGRLFSISDGALVRIEPYDSFTSVLTLKGLGGATGLAFSKDGSLFAVNPSQNGMDKPFPLYRIDLASGQVTVVGDTGIYRLSDLACSPNGTLYGWSVQSGLVTIDQTTGFGTIVNPSLINPGMGLPFEIQALTFGSDGTLYGIRDALFKIDTATGIPVRVGSGGYSDIRGVALIRTPDDPLPITVERQETNLVVHYFKDYYRLEWAPTLQGPWSPINSPSPYVEALSTAPLRFFRVVR